MIIWLFVAILSEPPPSTQLAKAPKVKLHRQAPPSASQIDAAKERARSRGVAAAGVHVPCDAKLLDHGSWHKLPDGRPLWVLQIESPHAKAIRLHLKQFAAGKGQLWIHAGKEIAGPYTGQGPHGGGDFWSDTLFAPQVTIEFLPEGPKPKKLPFTIDLLSYQF